MPSRMAIGALVCPEFAQMKKSVLGLGGAFVALAGAGALYAAAASAPAQADPAAVPGRPMGDGGITWAQAQAQADALWQKMDVNKDGKISKDEFLTYIVGGEELDDSGCFVDRERENEKD